MPLALAAARLTWQACDVCALPYWSSCRSVISRYFTAAIYRGISWPWRCCYHHASIYSKYCAYRTTLL